jgi:hypothetical protein
MTKISNKELAGLLYDVVTWLESVEKRLGDIERAVSDQDTRMATPPPVLGPAYRVGSGTVTGIDGQYYTVNYNLNLPKPDDDGREGIAVH